MTRYRHKSELAEVAATFVSGESGGNWIVDSPLVGDALVLTDSEFHSRFERIPGKPWERLCTTCRHHEPAEGRWLYGRCVSPNIAINVATGERNHGLSTLKARSAGGLCGTAGAGWEPVE